MKKMAFTMRIEEDLQNDLLAEALRRNQTPSSLARNLIRDGLAQYNKLTEDLLENGSKLQELTLAVDTISSAILHVVLSQRVLAISKNENETDQDYTERQRKNYVSMFNESIQKGERISDSVQSSLKTKRTKN